MKKQLIFLVILFIASFSYSQNDSNTDKRVNEIRNLYSDVVKNLDNYEEYIIHSPYADGAVFEDTLYYEFDKIKLIKILVGTEFSSYLTEFYFNNGKIFFIYIKNVSEGHWSETPISFNLYEARYYFEENEKIIKILEKNISGPDVNKMDEIAKKTPNKEISISENYKSKKILNIGKKYKESFEIINNLHFE